MTRSSRMVGEPKRAEDRKKEKPTLLENEKSRQERAKLSAKLKALRLAKEAADQKDATE